MDLLQSILAQTNDNDTPPSITTPQPSSNNENFAAMMKSNNDTNTMLQQILQQMAGTSTIASPATNVPRQHRNRRAQQSQRGGTTHAAPVQAGRGEMTWRKIAPGPGEPHTKTFNGEDFEWCGTCMMGDGLWTRGVGKHGTAAHDPTRYARR